MGQRIGDVAVASNLLAGRYSCPRAQLTFEEPFLPLRNAIRPYQLVRYEARQVSATGSWRTCRGKIVRWHHPTVRSRSTRTDVPAHCTADLCFVYANVYRCPRVNRGDMTASA